MLNTSQLNTTQLDAVLSVGGGGHVPGTPWTAQDYFNYSDWNYIESNIVSIAALLQKRGYTLNLTTITNRTDGSTLDFYDSLNRIEGNILALFNCYGIAPPGWITPKTTWTFNQPFSYVDTNRIEGNELALYNLVTGAMVESLFCGQNLAICGLGWHN
ncbi:conserved hypothetical protein [Candidatus Desulfosporosinus infrequens]|uniref:Uncharacterized protein n=1 Tax=Candidatus Desulfosporosinus infrequens TaxID=2043169 RepID=A0A2U3LH14_9FIRM|nr:conserved hypothetical protein [Candidatus Desulfosporosinus infrequens]